jgi:hypothetical protein
LQLLFVQKYLFRLFYVFAFALFIGIFVYAFKTEMAMEEVGDEAPFSELLRADNDTLPVNRSITAAEPHRTPRELSRWVSESVSNIMTLDAQNFEQQVQNVAPYFSTGGYAEFQTYLQQADLKNVLTMSDLKANVIVEQNPLLLNSGPVSGSFRWLYEVPVTVSYTPRTQKELKPSDGNISSRKLNIRMQLGRYDAAKNDEGVQIESWSVSARR